MDSTTVSLLSDTLSLAMVTTIMMMETTTLNARSPSGGTHAALALAVSPTKWVSTTTIRFRTPGANGGVTTVSSECKLRKAEQVPVACTNTPNPSMLSTSDPDEHRQHLHNKFIPLYFYKRKTIATQLVSLAFFLISLLVYRSFRSKIFVITRFVFSIRISMDKNVAHFCDQIAFRSVKQGLHNNRCSVKLCPQIQIKITNSHYV
mgnify:CR=1 FL=1